MSFKPFRTSHLNDLYKITRRNTSDYSSYAATPVWITSEIRILLSAYIWYDVVKLCQYIYV